MRLIALAGVLAAALLVSSQAQACRVYHSPMPTYDGWFENADQIVFGRVASVGRIQEVDEHGHPWFRPVMEVEPIRVLRGAPASDRISVRGEDLAGSCQPTLDSGISTSTVGDEVLVMLDGKYTAFGLINASTDVAQSYVARLTPAQ